MVAKPFLPAARTNGSPTVSHARCIVAALLMAWPMTAAMAADPIPQTEQSDVATLPAPTAHRVLVTDGVFLHAKDGRIDVVDGDSGHLLGMMPAAYYANLGVDPHGRQFYIAETIWTRGNRGTRQDLLSIYDAHTLKLTKEIDLPGRALITTKKQQLDVSADGSRVYIYNLTPGSAAIVVDTAAQKVAGSIDTPGCGLIFAWGNTGFSSICADGSLLNVDTADVAKPVVTHTPPFFAPDTDPVFEQSPTDRTTGHTWFISYTGLVYDTMLGAHSAPAKPWSINVAAGLPPAPGAATPFATAWRPGGWQIADLHRASGHLYVLMHQGTFWTHKANGTEVWELDSAAHSLVRRIKLPSPSNLVGITQDSHPLLLTTTEEGGLLMLDPQTGAVKQKIAKLGDSLIFTAAQGQ